MQNGVTRKLIGGKRLRIIGAIIALLCLYGCAPANVGKSAYMREAQAPTGPPPKGQAMLCILRPHGLPSELFAIYDGATFIGLSQSHCYFCYKCEPGEHLIIGIAQNKDAFRANLEAGKTYYAIVELRMGWFRSRMHWSLVRRGSELWSRVDKMLPSLQYVEPKPEWVGGFDEQWKEGAQETADYFRNDPEVQQYIGILTPEDGR